MRDKHFTSRRKACESCVRSKRRCDMKSPCGRCVHRKLSCFYPKISSSSDSSPEPVSSDSEDRNELELVKAAGIASFFAMNPSIPLFESRSTSYPFMITTPSLNFCTQRLRASASTMVRSGETPFMKPVTSVNLGSSAIHDAFAVAASYSTRNSENERIVNSLLGAKTREILRRPTWTFEEHLANAQALLLLHIIQLFDGDLQLRAAAERSFEFVQDRIMSLLRRQEHELPTATASSPWLKWTFLESVRRTYLTFIFVEAIYASLKQGYCELVPLLSTLPISVDGGLWTAKTEAEWLHLTKTRDSAVITYGEAVLIWDKVVLEKQRSLETLQEMLAVACRGKSFPGEFSPPDMDSAMFPSSEVG